MKNSNRVQFGKNKYIVERVVKNGDRPIFNPLKGYAPSAEDCLNALEQGFPVTMAFVLIKWKDIESEEGIYCFEETEQRNHIEELKAKGIRFIIRFVCDYPSEVAHFDIPDWLYEKTGKDGNIYNTAYGKGYAPNYNNPVFIEAHRNVISALGKRYAEDRQVAYIELGSLGHWGEWHIYRSAGLKRFPTQLVASQYIEHYQTAFYGKHLLLRRPVGMNEQFRYGLYNDAFGDTSSHDIWLQWIDEGYQSDQTQEHFPEMKQFWEGCPSGGEFVFSEHQEQWIKNGFEQNIDYIKRSHTSFLGPNCGLRAWKNETKELLNAISKELGYCFRIAEANITSSVLHRKIFLSLVLQNIGIAPIYENWRCCIRLLTSSGDEVYRLTRDLHITEWLPGEHKVKIELERFKAVSGTLYLSIIDPISEEPAISFANQTELEKEYAIIRLT